MPNLKIYMPDEEFTELKTEADIKYDYYDYIIMERVKYEIEIYVFFLKKINFKEFFPGYNIDEILPELKVGEDGFPTYDEMEVINGFDFNLENISNFKDENEKVMSILKSNINFNLYNIISGISLLEISDEKDKELNNILSTTISNLKFVVSNRASTDFKTKNATMIFELDGEQKNFDKVTLKLGGAYSRYFQKPGFNLKIRGKKDLYGRSQLKLRADCNDPTIMRTKLISDIHNRLGLISVSSTYVQLYINDEFMGLYTLSDDYKLSWVEKVYGEKNAKNLYKCDKIEDILPQYYDGCSNENEEEMNDNSEWIEFLTAVENAKSAADLEDIFEIDHFLYEMAIDYLTGSFDHVQANHNYYMYKQPNGKWIYLSHDFDHDFGQEDIFLYSTYDYTTEGNHLLELFVTTDSARFEKILGEVVSKVFNPSTLYSHIDEIKEYIKPYVILDKTPDANGNYPGYFNIDSGNKDFSLEQWDAYSEFTNGVSDMESYGLKYWILMKYRFVCNSYELECDPIYLDENYEYPVVEELNANYEYDPIFDNWHFTYSYEMPTETSTDYFFDYENEYYTDILFETPIETTTESPNELATEVLTESSIESPTETSTEIFIESPTETSTESSIESPTETSTELSTETPTEASTETSTQTYSESFVETQTISTVEPTLTEIEFISDDEALEVDVEEPTSIDDNDSDSEEEEDLVTITATTTNKIKTITKTVMMVRTTIIN
ncbi:coth-domain-containing protein [Piromyces finnis]|uniref:Coth-domain-containing protein n=1 Tax=Piromyces finnis TaxID=1754191 RepID=A0A1Y1UX04_9FUNG|nr:coth-domain-containing protein [Piromyces finnis]|eukprot:ORX42704.1 coth-domain-containing protein [Piromyces finnis]